jgi:general secretion pathway protein C
MNKRLPLLLSLLCLILLAASLAYWILQLYQPPQRPIAAAPHAAQPDPPVDAAAALFGGQLAVASATNFQLTGVIASGRDSVAILVAEGAPPKALKVGREISPGVKLAEVHPRYVMLSDGGALKRVDLAPDTKNTASVGGAPPPAPVNAPIAMPQGVPPQNAQTMPAPQPPQAGPPDRIDRNNGTSEPPLAPGAVQGQQPSDAPPANPNAAPPQAGGTQVIQAQ